MVGLDLMAEGVDDNFFSLLLARFLDNHIIAKLQLLKFEDWNLH